jgi:hypothetical protein
MEMPMPMPMPNNTMDMGMHMTFYNHHKIHLYFDSWKFDNDSEYAGAIVALFLASVVLESLGWVKEWGKYYARQQDYWVQQLALIAVALLHFGYCMLAYLLMLAVMSYNTGAFFAV